MNDVGVVLKVPQGLHAQLRQACAKHDRSMQKVLVSLIDGWLASGAPDPGGFRYGSADVRPHASEDLQARQAIVDLAAELKHLEARLGVVESSSKGTQKLDLDAFSELLHSASRSA